MAKFWLSKSTYYLKNYPNFSKKNFIKEYEFRGTLFVIDIYWQFWFLNHFIFYNVMTSKNFLNGWILVSGQKECLVECATSCVKSLVILIADAVSQKNIMNLTIKYPLCSLIIVLVLTSITDWQELSETLLFLCAGSIRKKNNQNK